MKKSLLRTTKRGLWNRGLGLTTLGKAVILAVFFSIGLFVGGCVL